MSIIFSTKQQSRSWQEHQNQWGDCQRCPIGCHAKNHVLGRGKLPCQVLLIGEAPGPDEDTIGDPFIGRSGKTLNRLLNEVVKRHQPFSYFITNSIACFPREDQDYNESSFRKPTKEEQANCYERIQQILTIATPRKLVYVGKSSESLERLFKADKTTWDLLVPDDRIRILHPSYINRCGGSRSLEFKKTVWDLVRFLGKDKING